MFENNKYWNEISDMQGLLNKKIGRDTKSFIDYNIKQKWIRDYLTALEDEVIELRNCVNWKWWTKEGKDNIPCTKIIDVENAKIEAIDCLHFFLSLEHIIPLTNTQYKNKNQTSNNAMSLFNNTRQILICINQIFDLDFEDVNYFIILKIKLTFIKSHLCEIFNNLGLTDKDVYTIYKLKNEVNINRQNNNYSVLNKTEDDNNEIKEKLNK